MVRVSSPAKLRPWSELTAKMVMGVVPGLVNLIVRNLKNPVKQAENTQKDLGNSQEEKYQGNKNTKEKKDRAFWAHHVIHCASRNCSWKAVFFVYQKRPFVHNSVRNFWRVCSQFWLSVRNSV